MNACLQIVHELAAVGVRDPMVESLNEVCTIPPAAAAASTPSAYNSDSGNGKSLASGMSTALVNPRKLEMSRSSDTPTFVQLNQMSAEEGCLIK